MPSALPAPLSSSTVRRALTVPGVVLAAAGLAGSVGLWAPVCAAVDLAEGKWSLPRVRLGSFALAWTGLESVGVGAAAALWASGHGVDRPAHFRLQRWWADRLVQALRVTAGLRFEVVGLERLWPGPVVMCVNHSSLADALVPVWLLGQVGMRPRYVLKDELLLDPCLDIVGNRLPNHFVDRYPTDNTEELARLQRLAEGMTAEDACVIYPEGMVVTDARRARVVAQLEASAPDRARLARSLRRLAPVRPAGTAALLRGAPDADVVFVVHSGLEKIARLADAPSGIPLSAPVRVEVRRVPRRQVPSGDGWTAWLDRQWARLDRRLVTLGASG